MTIDAVTDADELDLGFYDQAAERALMSAVAKAPDTIAEVLETLPGSAFYSLPRGVVWDACRAMSAAGAHIHPGSVGRWLIQHDQWSSQSLSGDVKHVVNIEMIRGDALSYLDARRHAITVREFAARRDLISAATRARQMATQYGGDTSETLARMREVLEDLDRTTPGRGPRGWGALIDEFSEAHTNGVGALVSTPWPELNDALGGLFAGRQYVFGGRPGQGKSTAALNIAMHAAKLGKSALVISREMPAVDVTGRLIASECGVPLREINSRKLTELSWRKIRAYLADAGNPTITVDDRTSTLAEIKAVARAHHHRSGLDVLVVDYLQLITAGEKDSRNREQEVARVSRECKGLAMELGIATVIPAQLNRGSIHRADQRPTMSDLRDSGQIEQDADAVILLHRPQNPDEPRNGEIDFILDKNRHGPTASITLGWEGAWGQIRSFSPDAPRWNGEK